jgi:hypothetical protein
LKTKGFRNRRRYTLPLKTEQNGYKVLQTAPKVPKKSRTMFALRSEGRARDRHACASTATGEMDNADFKGRPAGI